MTRLLAFIAALLLAPAAAFADEAADKAAIKAAVLDYFHGQGEGSIERLNRAFDADNAAMVGVMKNDDGSEAVRSWKDMNEVLANWSKEPKPGAPERDGEILDMHVVDGRIATVMFRSTDRFYDALTLAKVNGQWKIIAKAFVRQ